MKNSICGTTHNTTIGGQAYTYHSDFIARCTYGTNVATGETKRISDSYLTNDLSARKAIASMFGLSSFRK